MEALSPEERSLLLEAIGSRRKKEDLETSLGRVLRRKEASFDLYVSIMGKVREEARRRKVTKDQAAEALTAEG
ncbi:hypothetical protein AOA80_01780 [Methanomassiliicoccales archaeon RumEn M1]|jgi:subtilase family serine protease|nr:hypothetical protein AOA80_01780 [Methanomassiliicoccales archaeon RumEn M1]